MNKSFPNIFEKSIEKSSSKNKLISFSLMWMGLGVGIIFLMTYLVVTVPQIRNLIIRISSSSGWLILLVFNMVLILGISFFSQRFNFATLISMYVLFIFIQGIFVSSSLYYFGFSTENDGIKNIFLLFLIPSVIFIIMGLLGYFQLFNFCKIAPFLFFATIGLIIFSIILIFVGGSGMEKWFSLFGVVIFSLWIGFDIWWIQRTSEQIQSSGGASNKDLIRLGLLFGMRLFLDFVNILMYLARLLSNN